MTELLLPCAPTSVLAEYDGAGDVPIAGKGPPERLTRHLADAEAQRAIEKLELAVPESLGQLMASRELVSRVARQEF